MAEILNRSIRLSESVKESLDDMKKSLSANEYIRLMLEFFQRGGIDPMTNPKDKANAPVLKGIEQIKKMIRAIERDKIDLLLPENARDDQDLEKAHNEIARLKQENLLLRKRSENVVMDSELRDKLQKVELFVRTALNEKNFVKASGGRGDYFVQPVYLSGVIDRVTKLCS